MKKHRLLSGSHVRWEGKKGEGKHVVYTPEKNNIIEGLSDSELESLGNRVELVGDGGRDWSSIGDLAWSTAVKIIEDETSAREVKKALEAEESGSGRKSVIRAAQARLADLTGGKED